MMGARPSAPAPPPDNHPLYDLKLVEHAELMDAYNADLAAWEAALEAERVKYDRIAFSGQVPVNHIGAAVGDYIVPIPKLDGSIGPTAKALPDMRDRKSVGEGKSGSVRVDLGGRRIIKKKK